MFIVDFTVPICLFTPAQSSWSDAARPSVRRGPRSDSARDLLAVPGRPDRTQARTQRQPHDHRVLGWCLVVATPSADGNEPVPGVEALGGLVGLTHLQQDIGQPACCAVLTSSVSMREATPRPRATGMVAMVSRSALVRPLAW